MPPQPFEAVGLWTLSVHRCLGLVPHCFLWFARNAMRTEATKPGSTKPQVLSKSSYSFRSSPIGGGEQLGEGAVLYYLSRATAPVGIAADRDAMRSESRNYQ